MFRQRFYGIGDWVRVHPVHGGYRLPEGLPDGARVRVIGMDIGVRLVEFRGLKFTVAMACIDPGYLSDSWASRPEPPDSHPPWGAT